MPKQATMLTIGHSVHPIEKFIELLREHGVQRVVDVRTIPKSRHNPQFNREEIERSLKRVGIGYTHLKELGGLRHSRPDSENRGWRNESFRGYADYMQTEEFAQGLAELLTLSAAERCALMCAEAVPWRCHRSLISDALFVRGVPVEHILSGNRRQAHTLTPFARIRDNGVFYPPLEDAPDSEAAEEAQSATAQCELEFQTEEIPAERTHVPAKKRKPKFTADKEARRRAREAAGTPPVERVIPDKRRKPAKHKQPLSDLLKSEN